MEGVEVVESVDCFPEPADDLVYLFVPHEYHPMVHEAAHPTPIQLRRSIALCTEQPGTTWFDTAATLASRAGAVVDINNLGARELRRRGISAAHAPLGYVPAWDRWNGEACERIDLAFLGAHTERRGRAIARCAPFLDGHRAAIHLVETQTPHVAGSPYFLAGDAKWRLLADTRVLLNVHHGSLAYMEWHRVLGAVLNGCVVLSEHALDIAPFEPGAHFISAAYDDLPGVLESALGDPARLLGIRNAAYELVCDEMPMTAAAETLIDAAERLAGLEVPASRTPSPGPMPKPPPERQPEWDAHADWLGEQLPVRMALKHLIGQVRGLDRAVRELAGANSGGDVIEQLGPAPDGARVSVLLTVHDYASVVGEALRSVALSDMRDVEVVVVDDASTDGSVEAIRSASAELPWLPVRLVRRGLNGGLAAARNLAATHAHAELLFVLDADNAVLPRGLGTLADALDDDPDAAFAYGLIEAYDAGGPRNVISWMDWDPGRLRYGNYIDAMAMVRRVALERVGGYSTHQAFSGGWEAFALWIAMADAGMRGVRVPDFVARYRMSGHSMLSLNDIDHSEAWATLLRAHPSLLNSDTAPTGGVPAVRHGAAGQ